MGSTRSRLLAALVEKSAALEDKRRQLLDAAVRVFARKGYHASRVGDIAEEAGVAHGLLYHYFKSKDQVLEAVFHENWSLLVARIESVEETDEPAADQLRHISAIVLRTWLHLPDVVRVVIQEFGRSPELAERSGELREAGGADVAARQNDPDGTPASLELPAEERGDSDGAARLGDELQPVEQEGHRVDDLLVGHGDDLVHQPAVHLERQLPGLGRLQPVGDGGRDVDANALAGGEGAARVVSGLRLDSDRPDPRPQRLRDGRAACHQAAAAHRHEEP